MRRRSAGVLGLPARWAARQAELDNEPSAPERSALAVVVAAGQVRAHAEELIAWAHGTGVALLLVRTDRQALLQARMLRVSVIMLFQTGLSGAVVRAFHRVAPAVPVLHVAPEPEVHDGVSWASSGDPDALIQRLAQLLPAEATTLKPLSLGPLLIDPERGSVWIGRERIRLARAQFHLLHVLLRDRGRTFDRETLCADILGTHGSPRRIDWHVARLRAALGPMAACIETWPTGYSIADPGDGCCSVGVARSANRR